MRDLDRGILGRGAHGLEHYEKLRRGTDLLVNGILRVRRLLKQKRAADADGAGTRLDSLIVLVSFAWMPLCQDSVSV